MILACAVRATLKMVSALAATLIAGTLTHRFGPGTGFAVYAASVTAGCLLGAWLLRTSPLGRANWKNRVAAYLIPWGWQLNRGTLWPIPAVSWLVWMAAGAVGAVAVVTMDRVPEPDAARELWAVATIIAWYVNGGALLYVLGVIVRNYAPGSKVPRTLLKVVAVIVLLLFGSFALFVNGLPREAALLAGGPPLLLGGAYGLFIGVLLTFGRNARWN